MKWVRDGTRRFSERPYYEQDELDFLCEEAVSSFLRSKYGAVSYPMTTDDLTILIESETADLDLGVDLSTEGDSVEGVTDFLPNSRPRVRISEKLAKPSYENRLRTTLAHEFGHVKLHAFLFPFNQVSLFEAQTDPKSPRCKRETIINAADVDWMEWQAGYASGAFLMPLSQLQRIVRQITNLENDNAPILVDSARGRALIQLVQETFTVSEDAARVRLIKRNYLVETPTQAFQWR